MILQPHFHVGMVVDALEPTMDSMTVVFGTVWRTILEFPLTLRQGDDLVDGKIRAVYSAGGPPAVELFEPVAGSVLTSTGGGNVHHLGYWSNDLAADARRLQELGWSLAATVASDDDEPTQFTLHHWPSSDTYIELVDPARLRRTFGDLMPADETASIGGSASA